MVSFIVLSLYRLLLLRILVSEKYPSVFAVYIYIYTWRKCDFHCIRSIRYAHYFILVIFHAIADK